MLNQIIYNTKPDAYQMQFTVIKRDLLKEDARFLEDNTYVRDVTLKSAMDDYRYIFESLHTNKKSTTEGSVMLVATPPPKGKKFPNQF
jgi:hypothetical protein